MVVPKQGNSAPTVATACWGDCCTIVPYCEYLARGDIEMLREQYPVMKKFLGAVKFWASLSGPGKYRKHIWNWLFQFGEKAEVMSPENIRREYAQMIENVRKKYITEE